MATQHDYDILAQLYLDARERLFQTITGPTGVGTKTYANTILKQLDGELRALKKASKSFVDTRVPAAYKRELNSLYAYFTKSNLMMSAPSAFASLHQDAIYTIARDMQYQLDDALIAVGRQVTRYVERAQDEALRQTGLRQAGIKAASGGTVQDMQKALIKDLQDQGFMTVQYGSGKNAKQVPVDAYAGMVARSTTREAGNTARLNQLTANGYDLVKMTEHYPTCSVCAPLQGRIYSISGNDKRFPPLSKAFGAYNNIHPNCRHSATPWIESMHTPQEVAEAVTFSSRPFADNRSTQEIARYNQQQNKNRQARETIYQYERYRAALGNDAPKSYTAFARMKQRGGEPWALLQRKYRLYQDASNNGTLPFSRSADVPEAKIKDYLLSLTHPVGKHKARVIRSALGHGANNWQTFSGLIQEELSKSPVAKTTPFTYTANGVTIKAIKYEVPMVILKDTMGLELNTVWQLDDGSDIPRFITATFPKKKGGH